MSRSNPTPTNPAKRFFTWKGSTGKLVYWDKEKEQEIEVKLPFEFLVLDELSTITGFSKLEKSGMWSNEVRNIAKEELTIRTKNEVKFTGLYKNEQGLVQIPKGANYARSIYIAFKDESGEFVIGNIKASGSARGAWFDFSKLHKVENGKVIVRKGAKQEAQTGPFYPPEFEYVSEDHEEHETAVELDKELQVYLSQYLSSNQHEQSHEEDLVGVTEGSVEDLNFAFADTQD